jgi:PAS domain S-box-containing protein
MGKLRSISIRTILIVLTVSLSAVPLGLIAYSALTHHSVDSTVVALVLTAAGLVSLTSLLFIYKKLILNNISAIQTAMRKISCGDLDVRISESISGDEFRELARSFDAMAGKLTTDSVTLTHAYEAQKASEIKYRELVEKANSIILKWNSDGKLTYFNEFAEKFFGFTSDEIIGQNIIGTIVPETESSGRDLVEMIKNICKSPSSFINNENENTRKNGDRVWISWNNHPLEAPDGTVIGILSIGQDITDRKRIEWKLQNSEQRFRSFVENLNDVLFAMTPTGVFSYVSPQWKTAFGYELSETIGQPFVPFVHPDDVPACFAFLQLVFETGKRQSGVEYRVLCKNGEYLWYKANASLITDPVSGTPTLVAIGRDITERKLAEKTLRQSEEKFSAAFRASPDAVTLSRLSDGSYLEVNDGFTAITGYTNEEALSSSSSGLHLWTNPEQREYLLRELNEHRIAREVEAHFRRKDGSIIIGQISARIIEINSEPYVLAITRDVTEQEHIQKELIKAQKLESISVLAGGIAHNFNNVLTGVIGYITYAKKHLKDPDKVLQILDSAEKSSYRAAGLARQLLTFSQGASPVKKPVAVDNLVQESVSLFLSGTNVKGMIECSSHQIILADCQQINQVFNNIVLNALQAMPNGGILTVTAETIRLKTGNKFRLQPAMYVRIIFEDTGMGIKKDDLGKIFDPYFTTKDHGTGLGLSTTHSIISKHGGCIDVSSKTDTGTIVTIFLPTSTERLLKNERTDALVQHIQSDISILVMDDELMIQEVAGEILRDLGYKVTTCGSGEEAVALYKTSLNAGSPFSIVIMDLIIPGGMGGIEAARLILELSPKACLLASSGDSNGPAMAEHATYGFCGTITKPYNAEDLSRALRETIKHTTVQ